MELLFQLICYYFLRIIMWALFPKTSSDKLWTELVFGFCQWCRLLQVNANSHTADCCQLHLPVSVIDFMWRIGGLTIVIDCHCCHCHSTPIDWSWASFCFFLCRLLLPKNQNHLVPLVNVQKCHILCQRYKKHCMSIGCSCTISSHLSKLRWLWWVYQRGQSKWQRWRECAQ